MSCMHSYLQSSGHVQQVNLSANGMVYVESVPQFWSVQRWTHWLKKLSWSPADPKTGARSVKVNSKTVRYTTLIRALKSVQFKVVARAHQELCEVVHVSRDFIQEGK